MANDNTSGPIGIVAHGAYLPHHRVRRAAIADALGEPATPGARTVAGYDEDTTTMAVEAGRIALRRVGSRTIDGIYFTTATPAYLDKTNATAIHAALDQPPNAIAVDMGGGLRSTGGAWRAAIDAAASGRTTLAVASDVRTGMPGGADERDGGDAGAALVFGRGDDVVAEVLAFASVTHEFLDRWRLPDEATSRVWEERFGEQVYVPLAQQCIAELRASGASLDDVDHVVVTGMHARAVRQVPKSIGLGAVTPDHTREIGNTGVAHAPLLVSDVLDRALPGETVLVVNLADGVDAMLLRTTGALAEYRAATDREHASRTLSAQLARTDDGLTYTKFLMWRNQLVREPPRREDPDRPMAPVAHRREAWKFAFVGSRCRACGTRHLPPQRVCFACQAVDAMDREPFADMLGTVSTSTIDRLAYSPSPPVLGAVVDFDGGGRYQCEVTDVVPDDVRIGTKVEPTFRRLYTAGGIHDYFWKVRPAAT